MTSGWTRRKSTPAMTGGRASPRSWTLAFLSGPSTPPGSARHDEMSIAPHVSGGPIATVPRDQNPDVNCPVRLLNRTTWAVAVRDDFAAFRQAGLTSPLMPEIEKMLAKP